MTAYVSDSIEILKLILACMCMDVHQNRVSSSSDQDFTVGVNSQQDQILTCRGHQSLEKTFSYR